MESTMEQKLIEQIEGPINTALEGHKGSCEFVKLEGGVAYLKLKGACSGCPGRQQTFLNGIKPHLLGTIEGLTDVVLEAE